MGKVKVDIKYHDKIFIDQYGNEIAPPGTAASRHYEGVAGQTAAKKAGSRSEDQNTEQPQI